MNYHILVRSLITELRAQGADYVDVRYHLFDEVESLTTQNGKLLKHQLITQNGFGIRVLMNGGWGFASGENFEHMPRLGKLALKQAQESALFRQFPVALGTKKNNIAQIKITPQIDPWDVPLQDKIERLLALESLLKSNAIDLRQTHTVFTKRKILYLDSEGTELEKEHLDIALGLFVYGKDRDQERQRRSFQLYHDTTATLGWESLLENSLEVHAERIKTELHEILTAPQCEKAKLDIILLPEMMALQTHETIGHALELDRILGYELSYAGGSHVTLEDFGKLQFGSPKLNAWADGTTQNSPGSTGFDDDGVACKKVQLIQDGLLVGAITSRQMVAEANLKAGKNIFHETGAANRASSYNRFPIERMNNINIEAGSDGDLEDIIKNTENGMILETPRSWSIGPNRENFHFAPELGIKVKDGKRAQVVKNPTYSGESLKFWHALDMVGSDKSWQLQQVFNCGKGQPNQFMRLGHGIPICRFKNINVGH